MRRDSPLLNRVTLFPTAEETASMIEASSFPRLLVATEFAPNASGGGPAVVRQMLRDWPEDRLFWWSVFPERDRRFGQKVREHFCANPPARLVPRQRLSRLKSFFLEHFCTIPVAAHLRSTLDALRPDAVWVIPHEWAIPSLVKVLPGSGIGYHVTVQDYPDGEVQRRRFGKNCCRRLLMGLHRLYREATSRDATSHPMIADLQAATGQSALQMLHAGLEHADFQSLAIPCTSGNNSVRVAHAGTIVIEEAFGLFVKAANRVRAHLSKPLELHLFGAHSYRDRSWFDTSWMSEHGNLSETDLREHLKTCDLGLSLMALDDDNPRYNRFSFPTKFITYLSAGLPSFTLGHAQSSVVLMARQYPVGVVCSTASVDGIAESLSTALRDEQSAVTYRKGITDCASMEFNATKMRENLFQAWLACARSTASFRS
jgi:hypothetical protein